MVLSFEPYCGDFQPRPVAETMLRVGVHALLQAHRTKKTAVTWFDQKGKWVGLGNITKPDKDIIRVDYATNEVHFVRFSRSALELTLYQVEHGGYERPSFRCGNCGRLVDKILKFEYKWACRKCHNAINMSTRMTKNQRLYAEYLDLLDNVKEQPAPRQHSSTFERQYERLTSLEKYWSSRPPIELPAIWYKRIHERFYLPEESPDIEASER